MNKLEVCKKQRILTGDSAYTAWIPVDFPAKAMFVLSQGTLNKATEAERLIGKLDGITQTLPDIEFFLKMFSYKDATSSAQIEGTQATMADALEKSAGIDGGENDAEDIIYYIKALNFGLERLDKLPLSLRFLREIHKELMDGARSSHFADPGNFRKSQNWLGARLLKDASFIPVPPENMQKPLDELEKFLYDDSSTLSLVHIAYSHAQFETIHPFLDGNGRVGRLLITFLLKKKNLIEEPVFFLSSYFKKNQKLYYQKLNDYHSGDVQSWLDFFLDGTVETAKEGIIAAKEIRRIRDEDTEKLQVLAKRESESSMKVLKALFSYPIVTSKKVMEVTDFSRPGALKVIDRFVDLGILEIYNENDGYDRKYIYRRYFDAFTL